MDEQKYGRTKIWTNKNMDEQKYGRIKIWTNKKLIHIFCYMYKESKFT